MLMAPDEPEGATLGQESLVLFHNKLLMFDDQRKAHNEVINHYLSLGNNFPSVLLDQAEFDSRLHLMASYTNVIIRLLSA